MFAFDDDKGEGLTKWFELPAFHFRLTLVVPAPRVCRALVTGIVRAVLCAAVHALGLLLSFLSLMRKGKEKRETKKVAFLPFHSTPFFSGRLLTGKFFGKVSYVF